MATEIWRVEEPEVEEAIRLWERYYGDESAETQEILRSKVRATGLGSRKERFRAFKGPQVGFLSGFLERVTEPFLAGIQPAIWTIEGAMKGHRELQMGDFPEVEGRMTHWRGIKMGLHDVAAAFTPDWIEDLLKLEENRGERGVYAIGSFYNLLLNQADSKGVSPGKRRLVEGVLQGLAAEHVILSGLNAAISSGAETAKGLAARLIPWGGGLRDRTFPFLTTGQVLEAYAPYYAGEGAKQYAVPEELIEDPVDRLRRVSQSFDPGDPAAMLARGVGMYGALLSGGNIQVGSRLEFLTRWHLDPFMRRAAGLPLIRDLDRGDITGFAGDLVFDLGWLIPGGKIGQGLKIAGGKTMERTGNMLARLVSRSHPKGWLRPAVARQAGKPVLLQKTHMLRGGQQLIEEVLEAEGQVHGPLAVLVQRHEQQLRHAAEFLKEKGAGYFRVGITPEGRKAIGTVAEETTEALHTRLYAMSKLHGEWEPRLEKQGLSLLEETLSEMGRPGAYGELSEAFIETGAVPIAQRVRLRGKPGTPQHALWYLDQATKQAKNRAWEQHRGFMQTLEDALTEASTMGVRDPDGFFYLPEQVYDDLKLPIGQWIEEAMTANPKATVKELTGMYLGEHVDEMTDFVRGMWDDVVDEIHAAQGPHVARAIDRWAGLQTEIEEEAAKLLESGGLLKLLPNGKSYARQALSRIHSYRAFEAFFNPQEHIYMAEMFDPMLAAEFSAKLGAQEHAMRGIGMAGRGPQVPRQELATLYGQAAATAELGAVRPEHIVERLGQMPARSARYLGMDMSARAGARAKMLDAIKRSLSITDEELAGRVGFEASKEGVEELMEFGMRHPAEDGTSWVVRMYEKYGERAGSLIDNYDRMMWTTAVMPQHPYYGVLAGTRLPLEAATVIKTGEGRPGWQGMAKFVGRWKYGKAVLNTSAHCRNMVSNMILVFNEAGITGLDPSLFNRAIGELASGRAEDVSGLAARATKAITQKLDIRGQALGLPKMGHYYELANKHTTLLMDTFVFQDVARMYRGWDRVLQSNPDLGLVGDKVSKVIGAFGRAYQWEEEVGKMAMFVRTYPAMLRKMRGGGLKGEALERAAARGAADFAERCLFNYRQVPPAINWLRGYGIIPFITFPYKALPATAWAALNHPARFATWPKMFEYMQDIDNRRAEFDSGLPQWMQTGGWLRLPIHKDRKKVGYFDLTYVLPWGDMLEHGAVFLARRNPEAFGGSIPIHIPLLSWLMEAHSGQDYLTGEQLFTWDEALSSSRPWEVLAGRLWQHLAPPLFFGSGATLDVPRAMMKEYPRFQRMVEKTPVLREMVIPRSEQSTLTASTLGAYFGLRTRPFDLPQERAKRVQDVKRKLTSSRQRIAQGERKFMAGRLGEAGLADLYDRETHHQRVVIEKDPYLRYRRYMLELPSMYEPREWDYPDTGTPETG